VVHYRYRLVNVRADEDRVMSYPVELFKLKAHTEDMLPIGIRVGVIDEVDVVGAVELGKPRK